MKIQINENQELQETEVITNCRETTPQILKVIALLRASDKKITGMREGRTYILEASKILYIDTAVSYTHLILCSACVKCCPEEAKIIDAEPILKIKAMLESKFTHRKEPELFLF